MFPLSRIGQGGECGREDCITCTQESRGEVLPPCNKRSVLYENICLKCNPGAGGESKEEINPPLDHPSIYVGETARSLYERGKEHWRGFRNQEEDSHINKHHQLHHGGEGAPSFHLRPARFFSTALTRQMRGGESKLYSTPRLSTTAARFQDSPWERRSSTRTETNWRMTIEKRRAQSELGRGVDYKTGGQRSCRGE